MRLSWCGRDGWPKPRLGEEIAHLIAGVTASELIEYVA
jgi:hypothetical protein